MTDRPDAPDETVDFGEQHLFNLLDRYVEDLHRGDADSCSALLQGHPGLALLFACLHDLERLVPAAGIDVPAAAETLPPRDSSGEPKHGSSFGGLPPAPTAADDAFGKYLLLREVGRGGMGVVFEARQIDLDRTVALKMIRSGRLVSQAEVNRFYAEARAAGRMRHPNIVGIHEVGQIHGQHYFAMDLVRGPSLAGRLREGPVDSDWAARCVATVARAVHFLHEHNVVHRDLKPSNILLDEEDRPFVTDFGLAKVFDAANQDTLTGTVLGTPSYMAPEQAAGQPAEVGPHSDVYSLGAILYELLTGRPPFRRSSPLETLVAVLEGEPTLPTRLNRSVPAELELICLRCLEKDPRRRYLSAAGLADDLERYLRREPIEAPRSGITHGLRRWSRREPALVSRLGGLLAAGTIIQLKHMHSGTDLAFHLQIMSILAGWAVVCFLYQWWLNRKPKADVVRFAWGAADTVFLTTLLYLADGPIGTLLAGYPLLIVSSGLFFRVPLVWFTTLVTILSFGALIWLDRVPVNPPHYPVIFAAVLAVMGFIVAYQVERIRVLSQFYEHRRVP